MLTFRVTVPFAEVEEPEQVVRIHQQIVERLSALPGVASADATASIPMGGYDMLAIAAAVALLLGTIGIYAVISYVVSQRTREIGVGMALGARRRDVRGMMLRHGGGLAAGGVALDVLVALALTRWMSNLLFGVEAADPLTFVAVSLLVGVIALLAPSFAARRAAAVDPIAALRAE